MRRYVVAALQNADGSYLGKTIVPTSHDCLLRYNAASTAYLTVPGSHEAVPDLVDGVRAAVWLVTEDGATVQKERLLEGPVGDTEGNGPFGDVTIPIVDDFDWFYRVSAWAKPGAALSAQTDDVARYSGSAEDRALDAISANVTRLSLPWNVPSSLGRGASGITDFRFDQLGDVIIPLLTRYRLQLTLERDSATGQWDVGVSEGTELANPLTAKSGILTNWRWKRQRPQFTRIVAGGTGEGSARLFAQAIDSALETQLGRVMEGFVDAGSVDVLEDLEDVAAEALLDAAGKSGIDATLRESSWFRFPAAYRLGTKVTIQAEAATASDVITEIHISQPPGGVLTVVPKVGFTADDPQVRLTQFVSDLAASVRSLERR